MMTRKAQIFNFEISSKPLNLTVDVDDSSCDDETTGITLIPQLIYFLHVEHEFITIGHFSKISKEIFQNLVFASYDKTYGINRRIARKIIRYIEPLEKTIDEFNCEIPILVDGYWKQLTIEALGKIEYGRTAGDFFYVSEINPLTGNTCDLSVAELIDLFL